MHVDKRVIYTSGNFYGATLLVASTRYLLTQGHIAFFKRPHRTDCEKRIVVYICSV